ncbi:WXG100 family type VII secretion target [Mycobacterium stomatepiae]|uniref:WXG100 family type VII secretion target n=1 Tax=Mycobacterium stomatepiae TaxID=470076 RepID=UPI0013D7299E|nr:hypothetical protein [Mycobacterium stomatepiae]
MSEIQAWDVAHLENAARDWTATARHWETSFSSIHRASVSPGGTVWEGVAAEAAQERAFADLVKVRGLADALHESAAVARRGAETLYSAKQSVLDVAREASAAGYVVGEDLSVSPSRSGAAARAQAQLYAAQIQERAVQLAVHDQEIAAKITAATAPLYAVTFPESPSAPGDDKPKIQTVDLLTFKDAPNPEPGQSDGPSGDDIRRVLDKLPAGNRPSIREVRTPQDLENILNWAKQHGAEIPNAYGDPSKGVEYQLPDGTRVGRRWSAESNGQQVLDIKFPDRGDYTKIHINPRGGVPALAAPSPPRSVGPPAAGEPATTPQAPAHQPTEVAPSPKPIPGKANSGGGLPGSLFGGLPPNSPATGPHPIHIPHTKDHRFPLLGEIPEEFVGPEE